MSTTATDVVLDPRHTRVRRRHLRLVKMLKVAGALTLLAFAIPSAALAHTGSAAVSCTAADYHFSHFAPGRNTVHYQVTVDNVPVAGGDFTLNQSRGSVGDLHVPLTVYGAHTISAYAWWGPSGTAVGETGGSRVVPMATGSVTCAQPPPPPPPAPAAPVTPAPAPAAPAPAPQSAVKGVAAATPASARLGARTACSSQTVRVTVTGRQIRDIAFTVNGRHVRTVNVRAGQRAVTTALPMRNGRAAQVVTARVRFRNGAQPRTLNARASRCAQAAVRPQFTG